MTDFEKENRPEDLEEKETPIGPAVGAEEKAIDSDIRDSRFLAALSYIGLLFLLPMLAGRRSEFAMFHCRQGIVLFALQSIMSLLVWPGFWGRLIYVVILAVSVVGFVQAARGERWEMPLLGRYARMLNV